MKTFLLVDGNAIMHRAFHALPPFKTKKGVPTNVIYGFFSMLFKTVTDFKPDHIIVCFDTPAPTFRKKIFTGYQIQRPELADEFKEQIPGVKEALTKAAIFHIEKDGYEADDLIGTIVNQVSGLPDSRIFILSGDKDIIQLVKNNVFVISPKTGISSIELYDLNAVKKRFNLEPQQIPDLKALMGDPSDNYLGAKGIGPKTAALLLKQFKTIDNLFSNLKKIESPKTKKILEDYRQNIILGKKLATIVQNVSIGYDIGKAKFNGFNQKLKDYLLQLEMYTLTKRLFENKEEKKSEVTKKKESQMGLF